MCNKKCKCGQLKKRYQDKWEAKEQQAYALENRGVALTIYKCPESEVWHLTSKNQDNFY
jgi:hypothetical protein